LGIPIKNTYTGPNVVTFLKDKIFDVAIMNWRRCWGFFHKMCILNIYFYVLSFCRHGDKITIY